jgi:NADH-quinone oxidoreductase subunit C
MNFEEIKSIILNQFGESIFSVHNQKTSQPELQINADALIDVCTFLANDERLFFDYLSCITCIDNYLENQTMEVLYHIISIPYQHSIVLRVVLKPQPETGIISIPSVSKIWKTANWHEREGYDLVGIYFEDHPDLRRILLPNDWLGFPLRKDYKEQEFYHGIKVTY